jgi:hypothetical protein
VQNLFCRAFGVQNLFCRAFGVQNLFCRAFGVQNLFCPAFGVQNLFCPAFGVQNLFCNDPFFGNAPISVCFTIFGIKANEYVLLNTPSLSIQQMENFLYLVLLL